MPLLLSELPVDPVVILTGRNGGGKSRLLDQLAQEFGGAACVTLRAEGELLDWEIAHEKQRPGMVPNSGRPVREILRVEGKCLELVQSLGLQTHLDTGFRQLSTGERRRVMVALALGTMPKALLLDEPLAGIDLDSRGVLLALFADFIDSGEDKRVIIATSDPEPYQSLARSYVFVEAGRFTKKFENWRDMPLEVDGQLKSCLPGHALDVSIPDPLVILNDITVTHSGRDVVSNFSWTLRRGENWQILGPNGCGKSTLMRLITGDHPQCYSNDVTVFGHRRGTGESIWDVKRFIGIASTELHSGYRVGTTAGAVVLSGLFDSVGVYRAGTEEQTQLVFEWLEFIGLPGQEKALFQALSYGEQRLLIIARALIKRPPLLILDEPCQGLDPANKKLVLEVIQRLIISGETQVLFITHDPTERIAGITHRLTYAVGNWSVSCET